MIATLRNNMRESVWGARRSQRLAFAVQYRVRASNRNGKVVRRQRNALMISMTPPAERRKHTNHNETNVESQPPGPPMVMKKMAQTPGSSRTMPPITMRMVRKGLRLIDGSVRWKGCSPPTAQVSSSAPRGAQQQDAADSDQEADAPNHPEERDS